MCAFFSIRLPSVFHYRFTWLFINRGRGVCDVRGRRPSVRPSSVNEVVGKWMSASAQALGWGLAIEAVQEVTWRHGGRPRATGLHCELARCWTPGTQSHSPYSSDVSRLHRCSVPPFANTTCFDALLCVSFSIKNSYDVSEWSNDGRVKQWYYCTNLKRLCLLVGRKKHSWTDYHWPRNVVSRFSYVHL